MRWASGIIGLVGAMASLFMGYRWYRLLPSELAMVEALDAPTSAATWMLIICGALGLIFSVLVLIRKSNKWLNAVLLILCGVLPLFFAVNALFGVPMTLAGLLALGVNYQAGPSATPARA